jgi:dolichol-phosphate mannosyltransferase
MLLPTIEAVIPLFNEEENVAELHRRLVGAMTATGQSWRITYVDDGSSDGTVERLSELIEGAGNCHIVRLSRNFGHQPAITAGLACAEGDAVILLDGDLQDPPELIPELAKAWQAGAQIVIARRRSRQERGLRRLGFDAFHALFKYLIDIEVPPHTGTFCLLDRTALDALNGLPESHRFFPGLRAWIGFRQTFVEYDRQERHKGAPKQTFTRLFRYAADGVLSFSFRPLRLITFGGFAICGLAFVLAVWFAVKRMLGLETAPLGFTTLCCAVFGLGGLQLTGLGIVGEYIGRIYEESKGRPLFIINRDSPRAANFKTSDHRQAA